jgi:ERCC4-type nuclease
MQLSIDRREIRLSHALAEFPHTLVSLPVGDILCEYQDGRSSWVAERKTVADLASSIKSGRWSEQTSRLHQAVYARIFFIVEGDLRWPDFPYKSLLGALLNAELRPSSHVIRSVDVDETAAIAIALSGKTGSPPPSIPSGLSPPKPTSKRKRDSETVWSRQLMCIPSISEKTAKALLNHFGNLPALIAALSDPNSFPRVRLDARSCVGKKRIELLCKNFCAGKEVD